MSTPEGQAVDLRHLSHLAEDATRQLAERRSTSVPPLDDLPDTRDRTQRVTTRYGVVEYYGMERQRERSASAPAQLAIPRAQVPAAPDLTGGDGAASVVVTDQRYAGGAERRDAFAKVKTPYQYHFCAWDGTCVFGLFCPCILLGRAVELFRSPESVEDLENIDCCNSPCCICAALNMCGVGWIYSGAKRMQIRRRLGLSGNILCDFCAHHFCWCCALSQEYKEMKLPETRGVLRGRNIIDQGAREAMATLQRVAQLGRNRVENQLRADEQRNRESAMYDSVQMMRYLRPDQFPTPMIHGNLPI